MEEEMEAEGRGMKPTARRPTVSCWLGCRVCGSSDERACGCETGRRQAQCRWPGGDDRRPGGLALACWAAGGMTPGWLAGLVLAAVVQQALVSCSMACCLQKYLRLNQTESDLQDWMRPQRGERWEGGRDCSEDCVIACQACGECTRAVNMNTIASLEKEGEIHPTIPRESRWSELVISATMSVKTAMLRIYDK